MDLLGPHRVLKMYWDSYSSVLISVAKKLTCFVAHSRSTVLYCTSATVVLLYCTVEIIEGPTVQYSSTTVLYCTGTRVRVVYSVLVLYVMVSFQYVLYGKHANICKFQIYSTL